MNNNYMQPSLFYDHTPVKFGDIPYIVQNLMQQMNIPSTQDVTAGVLNTIRPELTMLLQQAEQSNQTTAELVRSLFQQNQMQRMQIAKLTKERIKKPRLYTEDLTGCGISIEPNGTQVIIGYITINSIRDYRICRGGIFTDYKYVEYDDDHHETRKTMIPSEALTTKNLLRYFPGVVFPCDNKQIINGFLAQKINKSPLLAKDTVPEYPGFCFETVNEIEHVQFQCNPGNYDIEVLKECPACFREKLLPQEEISHDTIREYVRQYLNTKEKAFLSLSQILCKPPK